MKLYEKGIILITLLFIIYFLFNLSTGTNNLRDKIGEVNSSLTRIEARQSELTRQIEGFEKGYVELGATISNVGSSVRQIGTGLSEVKRGISGLNSEIHNFGTRLPEIEAIIFRANGRLQEAEGIVDYLKNPSKQGPVDK